VFGQALPETGPLPFWMGAAAMRALPFLAPDLVMRLVGMAWLGLLLATVWYASLALACRAEIQPSDPFGASATRTDFGRAIADCSVLLLMATFGLLTRSHETTVDAAQVAWVGVFLYGCAQALERPLAGGVVAGLAVGMSVATRGVPPALGLAVAGAVLPLIARPYRFVAGRYLAAFLITATLASLAWLAALGGLGGEAGVSHRALWFARNVAVFDVPDLSRLGGFGRTLPWFFWPAWPIAAWALWRWRAQRMAPAVALPLATSLSLGLSALFSAGTLDALLLPMAPPVALLAALGLPTLRRSISSLIDWFSVMTFTFIGAVLWAYWIAFETGWPPRMAASAQRAVPGFQPSLVPLELVLGLLATVAWLGLVYWRISRQPRALWRTVTLSSGGMVLTWCLLMTLWLPAGNFRSTYREVAVQAGAVLPKQYRCVRTLGVDAAQRATFAYFGGLRFDDTRSDCDWLLVAERGTVPARLSTVPGTWQTQWRGQRPADKRERFRLMRRTSAP
jgi:4-amino-4-deoxy-L-arabinose transferase-like glycosyltransferase